MPILKTNDAEALGPHLARQTTRRETGQLRGDPPALALNAHERLHDSFFSPQRLLAAHGVEEMHDAQSFRVLGLLAEATDARRVNLPEPKVPKRPKRRRVR